LPEVTASRKKHDTPDELMVGLLADYKKLVDMIGEDALLKHLTKLVVERHWKPR